MSNTEPKPPGREIEPRWFTYREAGLYMGGRTPEAIRMMCRRGRLSYVQQGKRIYIDRQDIDRMMEANKVKAS